MSATGRIFKIQPSAYTDQLTKDGVQLTKLPYPFFVDEKGMIQRQDRWNGTPYRVVGFQRDLAKSAIDLDWPEAAKEPSRAVGMYLVTASRTAEGEDETWGTHRTAVAEMVDLAEESR